MKHHRVNAEDAESDKTWSVIHRQTDHHPYVPGARLVQ